MHVNEHRHLNVQEKEILLISVQRKNYNNDQGVDKRTMMKILVSSSDCGSSFDYPATTILAV